MAPPPPRLLLLLQSLLLLLLLLSGKVVKEVSLHSPPRSVHIHLLRAAAQDKAVHQRSDTLGHVLREGGRRVRRHAKEGQRAGMASWQRDCDEVRGVRVQRGRCRWQRQAITHALPGAGVSR